MLFGVISFAFRNILDRLIRQLGDRLLHACKQMLVIALISIPCTAGRLEHIHIAFVICTVKIDERHMSFRLSVFRLYHIRAFLKCDRERLIRLISVFRFCTAEVAILKNLVCRSSELCLNKLLVKVAECLIRTVHILKHFVCFILVGTVGMQRNNRCCHRCKHAVVIIAVYIGFQTEFFQIIQCFRQLIKCVGDFCKRNIL